MEPDNFWKERYTDLEEEIREMQKDCRETHAEVTKDMVKTVESVHTLAREVNGKMTSVKDSINDIKVGLEHSQNKQKFYVITVLVSIILLLLSTFGNIMYNSVYNNREVKEARKVEQASTDMNTNLGDMNINLEATNKLLKNFLEANKNEKRSIPKEKN